MTKLKTAFGDPTHDGGDIDVYETSVDLDANGDGSTTVSFDDGGFDADPALIVSAADGSGGWSARGPSQATVTVSGGTADAAGVAVTVVAIGDR